MVTSTQERMRCISETQEPDVCKGRQVALCLTLDIDMCEEHHANLHGQTSPIQEKDDKGDRRFKCYP